MAGIAHRVVLTPATRAHSHQESVGLHDVAAGVSMRTGPGINTGPFGITCTRMRSVTACPPGSPLAPPSGTPA